MKRILSFVVALVANSVVGGMLFAMVGASPMIGAAALNVIAAISPLFGIEGLRAGLYQELWTGETIKAFRNSAESLGWLQKIRAYDAQVAQNNTINFVDLGDLTECNYNRVGLLVGDTVSASYGAAIGVLAGRIAACSVQRHIGRVKDGALNILTAYIGDKDAAVADAETLNNKGYITFRTFTGKSGYFFSDDSLATAVADDYRSIARRRTIDKAYRIVYATMLEHVNDEIPVTDDGELVPAMCKDWESEVIAAVANQMTANGELGTDPTDDSDRGVKCHIDYAQNVLATSKIAMTVQVKPYGYSKYIDVQLGFITTNEEE